MTHDPRDPATPVREWLFKADGQVFGPVPEAVLVDLVLQGKVAGATEVGGDDGRWQRLADVPGFLVHLKKAEARARVEAEVTGARKLAQRRRAAQGLVAGLGMLALLCAAGAAAWWLATKRPWERRSNLLDGFGNGIAIGAVRVGGGARAEVDEIAIPETERARPAAGATARRGTVATAQRPTAGGRSATSAEGNGLVLAQYDVSRIQQVVARRQGSLAPCVRDEARRSPEFAGEIPVEFAVGNDGRVAALWVDEPRFKSGPLRDCLLEKLREWSFDPFPGQRPVVSVSLRIGR